MRKFKVKLEDEKKSSMWSLLALSKAAERYGWSEKEFDSIADLKVGDKIVIERSVLERAK